MTSHLPFVVPMNFHEADSSDMDLAKKKVPKELTAHGTTPSGKPRVFVCTTCTRAFARLEHLRRHERSHTKEKPFSCGVCQRKFLRRDLLLRHAQKLHAGCADAITRLRRKLIKNSADADYDEYNDSNHGMLTPALLGRGSVDSVNFNLNLFRREERSRLNSVKDGSLHKQIFDRRRFERGRGASFSAQLGNNYAQAGDIDDTGDTVQFLTPQLLPTGAADDQSWLSNLLTIPGMTEGFRSLNTDNRFDDEIPTHTLIFGPLGVGAMRSNSVESTNSFAPDSSVPYTSMLCSDSISKAQESPKEVCEYGYSFYDIPDTKPYPSKSKVPLLPIKQELEDELMDLDNSGFPEVNFDLDFLNDIDELTQGFDGGARFLPNGYLFYGDNVSVSPSGGDLSSSHHVSPAGIPPMNVYKKLQLSSVSHTGSAYSTTRLFTKNMRNMINKSLSKYPISGIMTPTIPSNEKLEFFLNNFVTMFLSHFPFIHPSKLNEHEIMQMTSNEDMSNESARVCMPLLVATIGALLANNKNDLEHLYEASRRTIHIYLESRKNSVGDATASTTSSQSVNPLWLIQSLTLLVIYGLFSDNENNVYIVIRQLNALNLLVKTLIKSNRVVLFSINGDDEDHFNTLQTNLSLGSPHHNDIKFRNNINMQSQVRIVFMIYKLTNFILMMYNVPLTLSINDLGTLMCPNIYDEFLWNFKSYDELLAYLHSINSPNDIDFYLAKNENNTIIFKDLLIKLSKSDFDPALVTRLSHLSKYGFSSVAHGIFEIKQYEEMKYVDVYSILDNLTLFIDNARNNNDTRYTLSTPVDYEKLDYALVVSFVKICATIDFKLLKEQSWLRNYDVLTKNFHKFMVSMESVDDFEYLKVIDCCIVIIKLVLFRTDDAESNAKDGRSEIFLSELSFLANNGHTGNFGNLVNDSLQHQYNTCANFENLLNWKVYDEIDCSKNSIHSQMLFHVFAILSIFAIFIAKRNHQESLLGKDCNANNTQQFNQRFIIVLRLLAKIEDFLKVKYQSSKLDSDLTNLYLFSSFNNDDSLLSHSIDMKGDDSVMKELLGNHNYFAYTLEKSLYVLKIGELMLRYLYDTNLKMCIFKKLSGSLSQIRKFLIDDETRILT